MGGVSVTGTGASHRLIAAIAGVARITGRITRIQFGPSDRPNAIVSAPLTPSISILDTRMDRKKEERETAINRE